MDVGAVLSAAGSVLVGAVAQAPREDPAQDQLRLVIIGLLALAGVLTILTVVFWRATRPGRSVPPSSGPASKRDDVTVRPVPPPTAPTPGPAVWQPTGSAAASGPPARSGPTAAPSPRAPARMPVAAVDAPWPPPRVERSRSARPPRPSDPPDSLLGRLSVLPDLDPPSRPARATDHAAPAPDRGGQDGGDSGAERPTRSTSSS